MKEKARIEVVQWDTERIVEVATVFATNFAKYSDVFATKHWVGAIVGLVGQLRSQGPTEFTLTSEGVEVSMSAFQNPKPKMEDDRVIFVSPEPRIAVVDRLRFVSPRLRTKVDSAVEEIFSEMQDHFDLDIEAPPRTLVLPKERYATKVEIFNSTLLF